MIKPAINTKKYFQHTQGNFWHWAENGEVAEWGNGSTICYRDELLSILREVSVKGLPSIGSLMMILLACREKLNIQHRFFFIRLVRDFKDESLQEMVDNAEKLMEIITALPEELKTGKHRIHLINEIFGDTGFVFSNLKLRDAIDELNSGRIDKLVIEKAESATKDQLLADLIPLDTAYKKYLTVEKLVLKLRTGLNEIPVLDLVNTIDVLPLDVFEQLSNDEKTAGIGRLARRLIAALNIPMHLLDSGDQSYGGITDITNRGNYDKLLLSELAQDSDLLIARLVNNEALYFKREEPPENLKRQRTILVDTTLKMWGVPRIFAVAAAVALTHNTKHGESIEAFALGGDSHKKISLKDKEEIIHALEILDHSLHCSSSLSHIMNNVPVAENNEFFFITERSIFNTSSFHVSLTRMKESPGFILTVSRDGQLAFYGCRKGVTKLISTAHFDLEELLFTQGISTPIQTKTGTEKSIAFLLLKQIPLLFPLSKLKLKANKLFFNEEHGLIAVNQSQRVLHIPKRDTGCFELLDLIEKGIYHFGWKNPHEVCIIVYNLQKRFFKIYTLDLVTITSSFVDLSGRIEFAQDIIFNEGKFYIHTLYSSFCFDCYTGEVVEKQETNTYANVFNQFQSSNANSIDLTEANKFMKHSYSIMYKIKEIYIGDNGKIILGNYHLSLVWNNHNIRITENLSKQKGSHYAKEVSTDIHLLRNKNVKFIVKRWEDGSEAIFDSRGFLHLKSSDKTLAEITIVMISGMETACWASDGTLCGAQYFLLPASVNLMHAEEFYKKYIQPFIDKILQK